MSQTSGAIISWRYEDHPRNLANAIITPWVIKVIHKQTRHNIHIYTKIVYVTYVPQKWEGFEHKGLCDNGGTTAQTRLLEEGVGRKFLVMCLLFFQMIRNRV